MRLFFLLRFGSPLFRGCRRGESGKGDGAQPSPSAKPPAAKQRKERKDDAATPPLELTPRFGCSRCRLRRTSSRCRTRRASIVFIIVFVVLVVLVVVVVVCASGLSRGVPARTHSIPDLLQVSSATGLLEVPHAPRLRRLHHRV